MATLYAGYRRDCAMGVRREKKVSPQDFDTIQMSMPASPIPAGSIVKIDYLEAGYQF
jgi:hypothetical protein